MAQTVVNAVPIVTVEEITPIFHSLPPGPPIARDKQPQKLVWTEKFFTTDYIDDSGQKFIKYYTAEENAKVVTDECQKLYEAASSSPDEFKKLEDVFSSLVECKFHVQQNDREEIICQVVSVFNRLQPRPPALPDGLDRLPLSYFSPEERRWDNLTVIKHIHRNSVCLAVYFLTSYFYGTGSDTNWSMRSALNDTAYLINHISNTQTPGLSDHESSIWFLFRAYLWSFWQRIKTLQSFFFFGIFRKWGDLFIGDERHLSLRNFSPSPGVTLALLSKHISRKGRTGNECSWILELLSGDTQTFGLDFQILHDRYAAVLGQEPARCHQNSDQVCDGKHSNNCRRFFGATIKDQTAHDSSYHRATGAEATLPWDRTSFAAIQGPRAVLISNSDTDTNIRYCLATRETMAVSHVWSHGQGGRPEDGINRCLHQRYCDLAAQLGCDSYWMDTTCIPEDHELRKEAIAQINGVFSTSKAVLVCDIDLMKIDVQDFTISTQESLFAAVILSDWNTRAWTLLESTKGRRNIYILCKGRRTVNFKDLVLNILEQGRIDLGVFARHLYHMLPSRTEVTKRLQVEIDLNLALYDAAEIGSILSYRPASRPGDDFVIWSLLIDPDKQPPFDAVSFWRLQIGRGLSTGYLMSSAVRLQKKGLRWAPESPYATTRDPQKAPAEFHRATTGSETLLGTIRENGFWARWWTYGFKSRLMASVRYGPKTTVEEELDRIRSTFLNIHEHGMLLRPIHEEQPHLNRANTDPGYTTHGTLVVVCGSNKITRKTWEITGHEYVSYRWIWKGVYKWPENVPLPEFENLNSNIWLA